MASGGDTGNGNGSGQGWRLAATGGPAFDPVKLAHHDSIRVGPLVIDPPARRIVHDDGREELLEPRAMQVLVALLRADGSILSRDDLIDCCWEGRIVGDEAISSVLYRLRRAAKDLADGVFRIETIAKVGFRLVREPGAVDAQQPDRAGVPLTRRRGLRWAAGVTALGFLAAIGVAALTLWSDDRPSLAKAEATPSLAVLPFADLSSGRDNGYFADGMAEAIMGLLSDEPGVRVIGRTSIGMLGEGAGINEARTRLGVTHVLEGSVRRSGQALRVNVRLLDARDGRQVWAEQFDRSLGDVFAIQDDIGAQVLTRVRGTLAAGVAAPVTYRTSPEVYDLYLSAIAFERLETRPSSLRAKELLERAIRIDADYAPAYARLASYARGSLHRPTRGVIDRAAGLSHARRALTLAPTLGDAHASMGILVENERDWVWSIPHLQRAVELDPGNFPAWNMLGHIQQFHQCRFREAAASYRRASAVEPLIASPRLSHVLLLAEMGKSGAAAASTRRFTDISQDRTHVPIFWSIISFYNGDLSSAAVSQREARRLNPDDSTYGSGHAQTLRALGLIDEALQSMPRFQRPVAVPLLRGDHRAAAAAAVRDGDRIWRGPNLFLAVPALLRAGQDDWLVQSFDRNYPSVEAFVERLGCRNTVFSAPHLIVALRSRGRGADAERLLSLANRRYEEWAQAGLGGTLGKVTRARLLVLAGRRGEALAALDQAVTLGWLDQFWPYFSIGDRLFDPIRADPRFVAMEQRIAAGVRRERAELAAHENRRRRAS